MGGADGGTGGCGLGDDAEKDDMEDKFSLNIEQKMEDEDAHIKSMLHAVLSSRRRSRRSLVHAFGKFLEYFYREGVSVDIGAAKDYADKVNGTLYFIFHIRQLTCIQLINPETSTHWSSIKVKHMVRGAQCLEICGYGGKNQKKFDDNTNASDLSAIINNSGMDMPKFDNSKVSTEAGFDDALKSSNNSGDDIYVVLASIKTNNNNNTFDDLLSDKISGTGDSDDKDKGAAAAAAENMFVCDKKESVYDIMNSLVPLAPCKGYEKSKLIDAWFKLDKTNCECRNYCICSAWADRVREDNARAKFGPKYEPDNTKQRHDNHRVIPPNFLWMDKLENEIPGIACNTT
ncbi:hypothetical protein O3P69_001787 [Scylla paramamosain]|uniref:Uncharacterized protein n=1 Tax=Scylla paramamosain TaxID=85552 RepID=A0AAW0UZV2_SCYPA